jgi:hypothetical protein
MSGTSSALARRIPLDWGYYATNWSVEPSLLASLPAGNVYSYTLNSVTRYRLVPTIYNPTQDAFYASFDGTTLTNLIAARG